MHNMRMLIIWLPIEWGQVQGVKEWERGSTRNTVAKRSDVSSALISNTSTENTNTIRQRAHLKFGARHKRQTPRPIDPR